MGGCPLIKVDPDGVMEIPFSEKFRESLINGTKTMTSRSKRLGYPGEYFRAFGMTFRIITVNKVSLGFVARQLYMHEGCQTHEEFVRVWSELHPKRGFDPDAQVFVHHFALVGGGHDV